METIQREERKVLTAPDKAISALPEDFMVKATEVQAEHPLVYIVWQDASANSGWFTSQELKDWRYTAPFIIHEVGWIFEETEEYLVYYTHWAPQESKGLFGSVHYIPKTWILQRVDLTEIVQQARTRKDLTDERQDDGGNASEWNERNDACCQEG